MLDKAFTKGALILSVITGAFFGKLLFSLHAVWGVGRIPARTALNEQGQYIQYPEVAGEFTGNFGLGIWPYAYLFTVVGVPVAVLLLRRSVIWNAIPGFLAMVAAPDFSDTSRFELGDMERYITFTDAARDFNTSWMVLLQLLWFVVSLTVARAVINYIRAEVTFSGGWRNKIADLLAEDKTLEGETIPTN